MIPDNKNGTANKDPSLSKWFANGGGDTTTYGAERKLNDILLCMQLIDRIEKMQALARDVGSTKLDSRRFITDFIFLNELSNIAHWITRSNIPSHCRWCDSTTCDSSDEQP